MAPLTARGADLGDTLHRRSDGSGIDRVFPILLVLAMAVGPYLQLGLTSIAPVLREQLGLSRTQVGALPAVLSLAACLTAWSWGRWIDRASAGRVATALFVSSAIGFLAAAIAPSFLGLLPAVVLAGVAMGGSNPVTNDLIMSRYAVGRRGVIMGVKQSGVNAGILMAGVVLPLAAAADYWRVALLLSAVLPLAGLLILRLQAVRGAWGQPHDRDGFAGGAGAHDRPGMPAHVRGPLRLLLAYTAIMGAAVSSGSTYAPLFAFESLDVGTGAAGLVTAVLGGVGVVARLSWGRVADRHTDPRLLLQVMALGTAVGGVLVAVFGTVSYPLLLLALVVYASFSSAWVVVAMLATTSAVPPAWSGQATGLVMMTFYAGYMVGPISFGWLVDTFHTYAAAFAALVTMALAATVVPHRMRLRIQESP